MKKSGLAAPFLKRVTLLPEKVEHGRFPFGQLPFLKGDDFTLDLGSAITILVGENGSGKSTLIEGIAACAGFPMLGGSRDHRPGDEPGSGALGDALRLSWLPKVSNGFFFRAESFFGLAGYLDEVGAMDRQGGRELQRQSHGEDFMAMLRSVDAEADSLGDIILGDLLSEIDSILDTCQHDHGQPSKSIMMP